MWEFLEIKYFFSTDKSATAHYEKVVKILEKLNIFKNPTNSFHQNADVQFQQKSERKL